MKSARDAKACEAACEALPGVVSCRVAYLAERCVVRFDARADAEAIAGAVRRAGFGCDVCETDAARGDGSVVLRVEGMSCAACSSKVEKALGELAGVADAVVSVATHKARVKFAGRPLRPGELIEVVQALGFRASVAAGDESVLAESAAAEVAGWRRTLSAAAALTLPIVLSKWFAAMAATRDFWAHPMTRVAAVAAGCGGAIQVFVAARFYVSAWRGVRVGNLGMDLLVVLATSLVFAYSCASLVDCCLFDASHEHLLFDTAAMLITFVSLGKFLEARAKMKTSDAVGALLALRPTDAKLLGGGEAMARAAQALLKAPPGDPGGDVARVLPGEAVPADGLVVLGAAHVDESAITGEFAAVKKKRGAAVFASAVNRGRAFAVVVERTGGDSAVAQIAKLVEDAQLNKAPVQHFADAVASKFTPFIVLCGSCTFLGWYAYARSGAMPDAWLDERDPFLFALLFAVSVVVVACPCALGLATPTAVMVGTGVGARHGVLVKGGAVLEAAQAVSCVVLDKTGTLTTGQPELAGEFALGSVAKNRVLALAAAAEQHSAHPIAKALIDAAAVRKLGTEPVSNAEDREGKGVVCALADGRALAVGSLGLMRDAGVDERGLDDPDLRNAVAGWRRAAKTAVFVALDGSVVGAVAVADAPRPEARAVLRALRRRGVDVWMLTGDHEATAFAVAEDLGLRPARVRAGALPAEKKRCVADLQRVHRGVAMVGDGINDSPALAQADVGIAIGNGTRVAIEAADVVLVKNDLRDVVVSLHLAKTVYTRIKLNFLWASCYNMVLIPVAAGAFYPATRARLPPAAAAACMVFSSLSVVLSSLALKLYKPPDVDAQDDHLTSKDKPRKPGVFDELRARLHRLAVATGLAKHFAEFCGEEVEPLCAKDDLDLDDGSGLV
ncbi:hypothetical protein AURANDRAFT_33869 [Aureococcus anophagefferens]|uniref:HMA domain-containing protein n=1 Tax=Aureococcus anophagefferens TaxID=44056 RepID=F0YMU0_AURAN|nr:hypothetical protein AURANDRAFT_33869 [Aureococcus anophagefferens]EGB03580.1 hypothetical protein AURANDRAFT_33869 [Aureococcus anophagefferens]|eukprot:XP_009041730.1 hypothetical protein AURANDRAFT_33869 [Aureococcus anophagefferens]